MFAVIWFTSNPSPPPSPSSVSKLSLFRSLPVYRRERGDGAVMEPKYTTARGPGPLKTMQCSLRLSLPVGFPGRILAVHTVYIGYYVNATGRFLLESHLQSWLDRPPVHKWTAQLFPSQFPLTDHFCGAFIFNFNGNPVFQFFSFCKFSFYPSFSVSKESTHQFFLSFVAKFLEFLASKHTVHTFSSFFASATQYPLFIFF